MKSMFKIEIVPVPKPRMTQRDRWSKRKCVVRYFAYCDILRWKIKQQKIDLSEFEKNGFNLIFYLPMPKSWSKKKMQKMLHQPHQQKPDLDNFAKAFFDAIYSDDSKVWKCSLEKRWAESGGVVIS